MKYKNGGVSSLNRHLMWMVPLGLVLALALVWGLFFVLSDNDETSETPVSPTTSSPSEQPIVESSRPQPPASDHRQTLSRQTAAFLEQARELGGAKNAATIFQEIASGDESSLPASFTARFRIIDKLQEDKKIRAAALISVLQLGRVLAESLPEDRKIEPLTKDAYEFIYLDLEAGNAHVPLSLYLGPDAAFSFEYVWVGGRWIFSPYSFIDAVSAADIAASGASELSGE